MRTAVPFALGLLMSSPAFAGGIGVIGQAGFHTERVFWYSKQTLDSGEPIDDPANFEQVAQTQSVFNTGGGLEFLLGDRDDRVTGVFRFYYNLDPAQADPATRTDLVPADQVVSVHRDKARHTGMATMGLNWGVVGSPDNFQLGLSAHLGSGFLTQDNTEFLVAQIGPTINYRFARQMIAFADITYALRFRKEFSQGQQTTVGLRYMFD